MIYQGSICKNITPTEANASPFPFSKKTEIFQKLDTPRKTNMTSWKNNHLKMYHLLNMGIFHCYLSFFCVICVSFFLRNFFVIFSMKFFTNTKISVGGKLDW